MKSIYSLLLTTLALFFAVSCNNSQTNTAAEGQDTTMQVEDVLDSKAEQQAVEVANNDTVANDSLAVPAVDSVTQE